MNFPSEELSGQKRFDEETPGTVEKVLIKLSILK
jgi:hypothetical protein